MTDFRALCAELVSAWDDLPWEYDFKGNVTGIHGDLYDDSAVDRARAALAEPKPKEPTDEELYDYWISTSPEFGCADPIGFARAVLARWGTSNLAETRSSLGDAPQPVPVSERLPGPEDCDEEGRCWWWHPFHPEAGYLKGWMLRPWFWGVGHYDLDDRLTHTHWLPAHALPLPTAND